MKYFPRFLQEPLYFLVAFLCFSPHIMAWKINADNHPTVQTTFSRSPQTPVCPNTSTVDMRRCNSFSNNYNAVSGRNAADTINKAVAVMMQSLANTGFQSYQQQAPIVQTIATTKLVVPIVAAAQKINMEQIAALQVQFQDCLQRSGWQLRQNILDNRFDAMNQFNAGNIASFDRKYALSESTHAYLEAHNVDIDLFKICNGNILQQAMHSEFVVLSDHAAFIWCNQGNTKEVEQLTDVIIDFVEAGIRHNNAGDIVHAFMLSDACWSVLDCAHALVEGIVEGAIRTVDDIVHPIRTVQNIAETIVTAGYYIGKVVVEVGDFGYLVVAEHPDKIHAKWALLAETFGIVSDAIHEQSKNMQMRDVIKETTAFGVQLFLTPKALSGLGKFFNNAHKNAIRLADQIRKGAQESAAIATPEGVLVRIADSAVEHMKNGKPNNFSVEKIVTSVKNITAKEFTEIAKKLKFEKTNYRSHNQPVFKKGNRYITPDVDCHNGGVWKMADSVENLAKKQTRMGTYDINLNRIGD